LSTAAAMMSLAAKIAVGGAGAASRVWAASNACRGRHSRLRFGQGGAGACATRQESRRGVRGQRRCRPGR
jgi:hypothetical protein